ncbi:hypothetical protein VTK26DRAFT_8218 [Humicola hyalothermophila]
MPPTLDVSRTSHAKVVISPPRINLRRAASYNNNDRGPLSSTSSRFNFNHLVFSPPPSPGLPSLSPPVKKPKRGLFRTIRPIRLIRYAIRISSIFLVFYVSLVVLTWLFGEPVPDPAAAPKSPKPAEPAQIASPVDEVEMVTQKEAPGFPTPIVITDHRGRAKWTVSIPASSEFPLTMSQYADMCVKCQQVAARAQQLRSQRYGLQQFSLSFGSDSDDPDFIDIQEAQKAGYLTAPSTAKSDGLIKDGGMMAGEEKPVCKKSLTFVLESNDAGLGKTLLMLWIAYGLAQKEGRAFFIDDTRWAYGKYSSIFDPPPLPACSAPPSSEIIPCPRQARHLVASAATMDVLFGSLTKSADPPSESHDRALRKTQFALARQGYEALGRPNKEDGDYVEARIRDLQGRKTNGVAVGIHIRRGDRHPLEYQYRHSYMPLNAYSDAARELMEAKSAHHSHNNNNDNNYHHHQHHHHHGNNDENGATSNAGTIDQQQAQGLVILASDDPTIYESPELRDELGNSRRAQERIKLASKHALQGGANNNGPPDRSVMHKFVDESFGWEGGFFAAMFWNLGLGRTERPIRGSGGGGDKKETSSTTTPTTAREEPSAETLRLRSLVGRAYVMDLAVLAGASDAVVCAVSAIGCRLLAVMMGWQKAMEEGAWVNVDGGYGWMGLEW